jgi:hypothetical protein
MLKAKIKKKKNKKKKKKEEEEENRWVAGHPQKALRW